MQHIKTGQSRIVVIKDNDIHPTQMIEMVKATSSDDGVVSVKPAPERPIR